MRTLLSPSTLKRDALDRVTFFVNCFHSETKEHVKFHSETKEHVKFHSETKKYVKFHSETKEIRVVSL
jgi:hypothetical protein